MSKLTTYGVPPETLEKVRPIFKRLGPGQMSRINNVSLADVAKAVGYRGSLIAKSGQYKWRNGVDMLMDLCWYSEEEAKLFIVANFPYVYSKSSYGQVWF